MCLSHPSLRPGVRDNRSGGEVRYLQGFELDLWVKSRLLAFTPNYASHHLIQVAQYLDVAGTTSRSI